VALLTFIEAPRTLRGILKAVLSAARYEHAMLRPADYGGRFMGVQELLNFAVL
jgi:hypothetical protein